MFDLANDQMTLASLVIKNELFRDATRICSCSKHFFLFLQFWIKHTALLAKFIQNRSSI